MAPAFPSSKVGATGKPLVPACQRTFSSISLGSPASPAALLNDGGQPLFQRGAALPEAGKRGILLGAAFSGRKLERSIWRECGMRTWGFRDGTLRGLAWRIRA